MPHGQQYQRISVDPVAGALGAEISGVNLAQGLDDGVFSEIHRAFLENQVVFFRDQDLSPEQQIAFGKRFGELDIHEYVGGMPEYPEIIHVVKEADERGMNFGGGWHSDVTYQERPALGSILYAVDVPTHGGDTLFGSQYLAYETLSDGMKAMLLKLKSVHSAGPTYGPNGRAAARSERYQSIDVRPSEKALEEREHPVVRTHPETGRKGLYVNKAFNTRFADMTVEESQPLLDYLYQHCARLEFTCRFRWQTGSIAIWDNRCVHHFALNDYEGQRREMRRVTIQGDVPV